MGNGGGRPLLAADTAPTADNPRKVGVYEQDEKNRAARGGGTNWWIVALVILLILIALFWLL